MQDKGNIRRRHGRHRRPDGEDMGDTADMEDIGDTANMEDTGDIRDIKDTCMGHRTK